MGPETNVQLRHMTHKDIPFGMRLKEIAGWNQTPADWKRLIDLEPEGAFVAEIDRTPVGTATSISYEDTFGWVAMVLVDPDFRRRGVGTTLLHTCIDYLEQRVAAVKLDATPMGKKLYDTIGFVDEYQLERWRGKGLNAEMPGGVAAVDNDLLEAVLTFDAPVFGADRSRVIQRLVGETDNTAFCVPDADGIVGYGVIRPGANAHQLGPLVASDPGTAERLFTALLSTVPGEAVICDVLLPNASVLALIRNMGFEKQRYFIRMYRGENISPGRPELIHAASGPEKG
ncbi:MAG: GNAT family N-acetyltransferase [Armatimonadota bacterium]